MDLDRKIGMISKGLLLAFLFIVGVVGLGGLAYGEASFQVGETLHYDVELWGVKVGELTSTVKDIVEIEGEWAYHIVVDLKTAGIAAKMYTMHDELHAYIDVDTLLIRRAERFLHEGNWRSYVYIDFDQVGRKALFLQKEGDRNGKVKKREVINLPLCTLDATSMVYYLRGGKVDIREPFSLNILYETKPKEVKVGIMPKEQVELKKLGSFETYVLKQLSYGNVVLWVSGDDRRFPVKVIAKSIKVAGWRIIDLVAYLTDVESTFEDGENLRVKVVHEKTLMPKKVRKFFIF